MYILRLKNYQAARTELVRAIEALEAHAVGEAATFTDALARACDRLEIDGPSPAAVTALQSGYDSLNA